ncbi:MAG: hypothetical protein ACLUIR_03150 [Faecalibacterium prausnitzii]
MQKGSRASSPLAASAQAPRPRLRDTRKPVKQEPHSAVFAGYDRHLHPDAGHSSSGVPVG